MIVQNEFDIPGSVTEAFDAVTDIDRVARCFPGAVLDEAVDEDTYKGQIKVRLGPVQVGFAGKLEFLARDRAAATARFRARGKEQRGRGAADADVQMQLVANGDEQTTVQLTTDMRLAGAVAQYGRGAGVIQGVAEEIIGRFASNMEADIKGETPTDAGPVSGLGIAAKVVAKNIKQSVSSTKPDED